MLEPWKKRPTWVLGSIMLLQSGGHNKGNRTIGTTHWFQPGTLETNERNKKEYKEKINNETNSTSVADLYIIYKAKGTEYIC